MKEFDNLLELWNYCGFCPICQADERSIDISIGPDTFWKWEKVQEDGDTLNIFASYRDKLSPIVVMHSFGFLDSSYNRSIKEIDLMDQNPKLIERIEEEDFYFYINAHCPNCNNSNVSTADIETISSTNSFFNFQLEVETYHLATEKDKYIITLDHIRDAMFTGKAIGSNSSKRIILPLINLDFTNQEKLIEKIKTYILFS